MSDIFLTISLFAVLPLALGRGHHAPRDEALHQDRHGDVNEVHPPRTLIKIQSYVTTERDGYEMRTPAHEILANQCVRCHHGPEPKGGLDLTTLNGLLRGGDSGPAIKVGHPGESLLIKRVTEGSMPPISDGDQLPSADVEILRTWIQSGAAWHADRPLQAPGRTSERHGASRRFFARKSPPRHRWLAPFRSR